MFQFLPDHCANEIFHKFAEARERRFSMNSRRSSREQREKMSRQDSGTNKNTIFGNASCHISAEESISPVTGSLSALRESKGSFHKEHSAIQPLQSIDRRAVCKQSSQRLPTPGVGTAQKSDMCEVKRAHMTMMMMLMLRLFLFRMAGLELGSGRSLGLCPN